MKLLRNNTKMCINLSFAAVKVLLIFVIAIPRIRFFHTVTTNVIFGAFSTFSAFSKISKTASTIFLKLSQHVLDNAKNLIPKVLLTLIYLLKEEGVRTDEKVALQIQLSQFMLKYSNQCFLHSILINTVRCYCFQNCVFSLTLLLTRWNVKKIDLNILA